jgi:hypothetical protein
MSDQNIESLDLGELQAQADAARSMLDSRVFNEAFRMMNSNLIDQILGTPPEADAERERLYHMFKAGQLFVQQFATMINNLELRKQPSEE